MKNNQKTLIWQFYTEGSKLSYLLGTMHLNNVAAFRFEAEMKEKILACQAFATEFDFNDADAKAVNSAMKLPEGVTLRDVLSPKLYAKTDNVLKKVVGINVAQFDQYKPLIFTNIFVDKFLSSDRTPALDDVLWHFAAENGKILRGVETFAEQIEVLSKLPMDGQVKDLKNLISNFSATRKELLKTTRLFENAEIEKLYKLARRSMKGNRRLMIYDRNRKMAARIAELANEHESVCVAVGAGHFWGKLGVLNALKQHGFIVRPC